MKTKFNEGDLISFSSETSIVRYPSFSSKNCYIFLSYTKEDSCGNIMKIYDIQKEQYASAYDEKFYLCE